MIKERSLSVIFIILIVIITTSLIGCNKKEQKKSDEISVVDSVGRTVKLRRNPQKVACISRTTYDLLVACGLGDKIDGAYKGTLNNEWLKYIDPNSKQYKVYDYKNSYETFLQRNVDLVFAPEKYIADDLNKHGIPALCVSLYGNPTFDESLTFFSELIRKLWNDEKVHEKSLKWENKVKNAIGEIKDELKKHNIPEQKIYYIRGDKNFGFKYTDQAGSFTEYAYRMLGYNFIGKYFNSTRPSEEEIIKQNPDAIVAGGIFQIKNIEAVKTNANLKNVNAIKNNKIYNIPIGATAFEQLSVMTPIFFYDQANKLYPEYFNYDIAGLIYETIKESFNKELSTSEIQYMLNGLSPIGQQLAK